MQEAARDMRESDELATAASGPPRHVAIIMDGNGRWARARGLPRLEGHRRGAEAVRAAIRAAGEFGVEHLTLYAFSTENWRRPRDEVAGLMGLFRLYMSREADGLVRDGARVRFLGDPAPLPSDIRAMMSDLESRTAGNDRIKLFIALNYGSRREIVDAARALAERVRRGEIDPSAIDEAALSAGLQTAGAPDPDLVIRTSGEQRLSNFLLWQAAYAELVFVPEPWPEFSAEVFARAIQAFGARQRRFGALAV